VNIDITKVSNQELLELYKIISNYIDELEKLKEVQNA